MDVKLYYCSAIDKNPTRAFKQIEKFEKVFSKFPKIEVYGAGLKNSPIINPYTFTWSIQRVIVAMDLRQLRECDILLFITDGKTYAAGSLMELEYARQLGLMIIVLCTTRNMPNIFLQTMTDRLIYSVKELEDLLQEMSNI